MNAILRREDLDRRIRIERRAARAGGMTAGQAGWEPVATVWAQVQDKLPSRGEGLSDGLSIAQRPARVRMDWRAGVTSDMRVVELRRVDGEYTVARTMRIVSEPAELGRRDGMEFMVESYSTEGEEA